MDKILRTGKLGVNELNRSVYKRLGRSYAPEALCALSDKIMLSSDPITVGSALSGKLAVTAVVNDLAAAGAVPYGIEMTILLPPDTEESALRSLIDQIRDCAAAEQVVILGGHTEVTPAVNKPVLCAAGIGYKKYAADGTAMASGMPLSPRPTGCHILMTKSAGLEAMAMLGWEREEELSARFPAYVLETVKEAAEHLSIRTEAAVAACFDGTVCLTNLSEGGLYAALWSLSEKTRCGITVDLLSVPILQEMIEIANYCDFDPYMCESAGSLLIAVRKERADELIRLIEEQDIPAYDIGVLTDSNDKNILNGDEVRSLDRPGADSLRRIL